ncbi:MAG TPA: transcriptional regulator [Verrucomicrobia bacterium]|nr:transcriptional regulator [Verrucomicrobiota bacterium]
MKAPLEQLKALADRNRLRVVAALMNTEELCACQISELLGVTGATASRHMELLIRAGLIDSRKAGRWVHYTLSPDFPAPLREWLEKPLSKDPDIKADLGKVKKIMGCK